MSEKRIIFAKMLIMKNKKTILGVALLVLVILIGLQFNRCSHVIPTGKKVVVCIPVYGQSLALGEEAVRLTDFDELRDNYAGRILTQRMDYTFGYFDDIEWREQLKRMIHYQKRSFELSIYRMGECLAQQLGEDTLICIFPGGRGATQIGNLNKGTKSYAKFLNDIETACKSAKDRGWTLYVPAICWMQGETDMTDYPDYNYKQMLQQWRKDISKDIRAITHQTQDIRLICYQPNALTRADQFRENKYESHEVEVSQAFVELLSEDSLFCASGPTYPYDFVREAIHIDGYGQQAIGKLAAQSALGVIRNQAPFKGLIPLSVVSKEKDVQIVFNVPNPPLSFDTVQVSKPSCYGFSVVTPKGKNIALSVSMEDDIVTVHCSEPVVGCKVRYAVNGEKSKSGRLKGPRGNLCDSQHHWCYQFEKIVK